MDVHQFEGRWNQLKGVVRKEWGELTDDELDKAQGDWDKLVGAIQAHYGGSREEIERRLRALHQEPRP